MFGGPLPALGVGAFAGAMPIGRLPGPPTSPPRRGRRRVALDDRGDPHPHRPGRTSIPRALFEVGLRGPEELRPAFRAAQREWPVTTDFARTTALLKDLLDSGTADVVCETLLVANELGAVDLDRRLAELAEDRRRGHLRPPRRASPSRPASGSPDGSCVIVPVGMALAGMSLGDGRAAYQTAIGQALVAAGVAMVAICWIWSGRMLRLPDEQRVFP